MKTKQQKHWDQTVFWRTVWHLGWYIKPLKNLYLNKIRNDPNYANRNPGKFDE